MSSQGTSKRGKSAHTRNPRPRPPRIVTRVQPHRQCANRPPRFWRFLDLPAEVRNMIYSHILTSFPRSCFHASTSSSSSGDDITGTAIDVDNVWESHPRFDLSLLLVNKQIYKEAVAVLYSKNTFIFLEPCDEHRDLHPESQDFTRHRSLNWLRTIGPSNARAVRNMHIRIRAERTTSRPDPYYPDLILELSKLAPNLHRLALIGEKHALQTKPVQVQVQVPLQFPELFPTDPNVPPPPPQTQTQPLSPLPFEVAQPPAYETHWHREWDPNHVTALSPWMLYEMRHGLRKFLKLHTLVLAGFSHPKENFVSFSRLINAGKPRTKGSGWGGYVAYENEIRNGRDPGDGEIGCCGMDWDGFIEEEVEGEGGVKVVVRRRIGKIGGHGGEGRQGYDEDICWRQQILRQMRADQTRFGDCVVHVVKKTAASRSCGERRFSTLWNEPAIVDPLGRVLDKKKGRGGQGRQFLNGVSTAGGSGSGSGLTVVTTGQNAASTSSLVQAVVQVQQVDDDDDDDDDDDEDYWQDLEALLSDSGGEDDEMDDDGIIA